MIPMKKRDILRREAIDSSIFRGHELTRFKWATPTRGWADCKNCAAWVTVIVNPAPNEIDIGGPAVAVNCPITDEE